MATDRCTFAYAPDGGQGFSNARRSRHRIASITANTPAASRRPGRLDLQITGEVGPIPTTHSIKLNVPGWMSVGVAWIYYCKIHFRVTG